MENSLELKQFGEKLYESSSETLRELGQVIMLLGTKAALLDEISAQETLKDLADILRDAEGDEFGFMREVAEEIDEVLGENQKHEEECPTFNAGVNQLAPPVIWVVQDCLKDYEELLVMAGMSLTKVKEARGAVDELAKHISR